MAFGAGLTRATQLLTHRTIETLRPAEAPYRVPDQRCKGLAVRVAPSGVKTWDLAYRIRGTGKTRRLSLGRTTDVGLEQARERANELTSAARNNIVEQDHRRIKRLVRPGLGFGSFHTARRTLAGFETMAMMRKGQLRQIDGHDIRGQAVVIDRLFDSAA